MIRKNCINKLNQLKLNNTEYINRLDYELNVIEKTNFTDYFVIVADLIKYMKTITLVGVGRGSACSSLVCYLLNITEIDPIKYKLRFDRFLNERTTGDPDIDIDYDKGIDGVYFKKIIDYLKNKYGYKKVVRMITKAKRVHPSGILVLKKDATEYGEVKDGVLFLEKEDIEKAGLLKIDLLSSKVLSKLNSIAKSKQIDITQINLNDSKVYEYINKKDFDGIPQFSGSRLSKFARDYNMNSINDISKVFAMSKLNGSKDIYYQEQVMDLLDGKLNPELITKIYKTINKNESIDKYHTEIISRAGSRALNTLKGIKGSLMNKSHSIAYATVVYYCFYFKFYFNKEYLEYENIKERLDKPINSLLDNKELKPREVNQNLPITTINNERLVVAIANDFIADTKRLPKALGIITNKNKLLIVQYECGGREQAMERLDGYKIIDHNIGEIIEYYYMGHKIKRDIAKVVLNNNRVKTDFPDITEYSCIKKLIENPVRKGDRDNTIFNLIGMTRGIYTDKEIETVANRIVSPPIDKWVLQNKLNQNIKYGKCFDKRNNKTMCESCKLKYQ